MKLYIYIYYIVIICRPPLQSPAPHYGYYGTQFHQCSTDATTGCHLALFHVFSTCFTVIEEASVRTNTHLAIDFFRRTCDLHFTDHFCLMCHASDSTTIPRGISVPRASPEMSRCVRASEDEVFRPFE